MVHRAARGGALIEPSERPLEIVAKESIQDTRKSVALFEMAQALRDERDERLRALLPTNEAPTLTLQGGSNNELAEIDTWLSSHRPL